MEGGTNGEVILRRALCEDSGQRLVHLCILGYGGREKEEELAKVIAEAKLKAQQVIEEAAERASKAKALKDELAE